MSGDGGMIAARDIPEGAHLWLPQSIENEIYSMVCNIEWNDSFLMRITACKAKAGEPVFISGVEVYEE
jgi:hypothetical protein